MTCDTCIHSIGEVVKDYSGVYVPVLLCNQSTQKVKVVNPKDTCKHFEREPGTCDEMGRGDSGNWN